MRQRLHKLRTVSASRLALCAPGATATAAVLGLSAGLSAHESHTATAAAAAARVVCEDHYVGDGPVVQSGETVHVHYEGRLDSFDGPIFDSSYAVGEPAIFKIDESPVIQGWHEGVRGMRVGGRRKLTVPAELAYGSKGIKDPARNRWVVPPQSTLYFRYVPAARRQPCGSVSGSALFVCTRDLTGRVDCTAQPGSGQGRRFRLFRVKNQMADRLSMTSLQPNNCGRSFCDDGRRAFPSVAGVFPNCF